ncbi:DNA-binding transcription factor YAP1 KNAG_0B03680 [Huiozyma naganishii CBS 8797]|uniref:BZIP domain-containing protein n=1 Tax=Huiozyma naganishii (strain ATCC MYA-139 / BCRC 22969 / CBS 8797 / KCTC 17520 / NBRC 10181 / NCYC 3082 / Yp74L-3) TaxID=1071383 RepID=J7R1X2_HUIN7|nr:hypothetical protein KNAG_0B03680 [Kazachstania naganishii CBS 8797]CCK68810.1 hypothetical protein KNAG_0B03680 [Kazachstania naganishii CBS 8797]
MAATVASAMVTPEVHADRGRDRDLEVVDSGAEPLKKRTHTASKPLDKEARMKRTEQNRAAQRAFRERKERKMKELEAKVDKLTRIQKQNEVESEFLRGQLVTLVHELKKYRPETSNDSKVLEYLAKHDNVPPNQQGQAPAARDRGDFSFEFPWKGRTAPEFDNSTTQETTTATPSPVSPGTKDQQGKPTDWLDEVLSSTELYAKQQQQQLQGNRSESPFLAGYDDSLTVSNEITFDTQFDEQVSDFCVRMNEACGSKTNPVPKSKKGSVFSNSVLSPPSLLNSLSNTWGTDRTDAGSATSETTSPRLTESSSSTVTTNNDLKLDADFEIPFINTSLAFPTDDGAVPQTVDDNIFFRDTQHEQRSALDDFLEEEELTDNQQQQQHEEKINLLINEVPFSIEADKEVPFSIEPNEDGDPQVVPSKDGKLLKCSEIWDRITAHPKYSDLDIDGLCGELMTKAKCSERGVVVNADDVKDALNRHIA